MVRGNLRGEAAAAASEAASLRPSEMRQQSMPSSLGGKNYSSGQSGADGYVHANHQNGSRLNPTSMSYAGVDGSAVGGNMRPGTYMTLRPNIIGNQIVARLQTARDINSHVPLNIERFEKFPGEFRK